MCVYVFITSVYFPGVQARLWNAVFDEVLCFEDLSSRRVCCFTAVLSVHVAFFYVFCSLFATFQKSKPSPQYCLFFKMCVTIHPNARSMYVRRCFRTDSFRFYQTSLYRMNYYESLSGIKMLLNTDREAYGAPALLQQLYTVNAR